MTNIEIAFCTAVALCIVIWFFTRPYRCPRCKTATIDYYDEETGKSYKVCPMCGHKTLVGEEKDCENTK